MSGSRQELMDLLNIRSEILFNLCLVFAIMFPLFSYLFYQFSLSEFWFSNNSRKLLKSNPLAVFKAIDSDSSFSDFALWVSKFSIKFWPTIGFSQRFIFWCYSNFGTCSRRYLIVLLTLQGVFSKNLNKICSLFWEIIKFRRFPWCRISF